MSVADPVGAVLGSPGGLVATVERAPLVDRVRRQADALLSARRA